MRRSARLVRTEREDRLLAVALVVVGGGAVTEARAMAGGVAATAGTPEAAVAT